MLRLRPPLLARAPHLAALVAALLIAAAAPPPAEAAPPAPQGDAVSKARDLFKKGMKAYEAGHLPDAYESFTAAWALQKSYDIAGNLASVEMATARYRDAAEHLRFALQNLPPSGSSDKQRGYLSDLLRDARKQIAVLDIKASVAGAKITVDGRELGAGEPADEVFVEAGDHVITATAPDHQPAEQKLRAEKGATRTVSLTLVKSRAEAPPPPPPSPGPSPITLAGFITAGAGLVAGTTLAIVSRTKADDADTQLAALRAQGPNACAGPSPGAACEALHDARRSRDTFANAALWSFVGAGVVAAGTLVYTLRAPRGSPSRSTASVSAAPVAFPGGGALLVKGSF